MIKYDLQSTDFSLSSDGVHLLRNGYNFKTLPYQDLDTVVLKKGVEIKNSTLTLIIGVALTLFAIYQSKWVIDIFNNSIIRRVSIESIVIIMFPAMLGVYCIIVALKKGPVLQVKHKGSTYVLRVKQFVKRNETNELTNYLNSKLPGRFSIKDNI